MFHIRAIAATTGPAMLCHRITCPSIGTTPAMTPAARLPRRLALRAGAMLALAGAFTAMSTPLSPADAAEPPRPEVKLLAVRPEKQELRAGETLRVAFELEAPTRWHIYPAAKKPLLGRQTVFEFEGAEVAGPIVEPRPRYQREGVLESDFHEGRVTITVPVRLAPGTGPGPRVLKGRVVYQICDWNLCLNGQVPFQFSLTVIDEAPAADAAKR